MSPRRVGTPHPTTRMSDSSEVAHPDGQGPGPDPPVPDDETTAPIDPEILQQTFEELIGIMTRVAEGDFSAKPDIREGSDPLSHFIVAFRFLIEDLERAHQTRQDEIDRLREIDQMKTRFINLAAHELNTPLTPIRIHLHLLRTRGVERLDRPQRTALDALDRNMTRLSRSVGDLLDVARLQSHHFRIRRDECDLSELVASVITDVHPAFEEKQIELDPRVPDHLPISVDRDRILQVLHNLLSNARKFTPPNGRVTVNVFDVRDHLLVSVTDSGLGLDKFQVHQLFRPFTQVHADHDEDTEGTGLGLFITKGIIEAHGGRIWVESRGPGSGSRFTFLLPKTDASCP